MAWVKMGDDADMYPRLMEAASHPKADARTVNFSASSCGAPLTRRRT